MKLLFSAPFSQLLVTFVAIVIVTGCSENKEPTNANATSSTPPTPQTTIIAPPPPSEERSALSVTLSWTPPLAREDGAILKMADIGGYEIVSERNNVQITSVTVSAANVTTHTFNDLSPADYAFSIYTYDNQNHISQPSEAVSISLTQFPKL